MLKFPDLYASEIYAEWRGKLRGSLLTEYVEAEQWVNDKYAPKKRWKDKAAHEILTLIKMISNYKIQGEESGK